jgi:macrodomain Ter protein organizer (MatP/YcbG family)
MGKNRVCASLFIDIRQANYEKLRKAAERNGKTAGQLINKLIEEKALGEDFLKLSSLHSVDPA